MLGWIVIGAAAVAAAYALENLFRRKYSRRGRGRVAAAAVGSELSLPAPVRRVRGGVVTAGADVTREGVSVEVRSWPASPPKLGAGGGRG